MSLKLFSITLLLSSLFSYHTAQESVHYFTSFDGVKIAYTDEGKGHPVVLIHGFISNASSWDRTVLKQKLLDGGFRVIIPDLRGNGNSDKPQVSTAYANNAEVKDLIGLSDHLKLNSYTGIGYSRGSIILAELLTQEKRMSKAVLGGMGLDFTNPDWDRRIMFAEAFDGKVTSETQGAVDYAKSIDADLKVLSFLQQHQPSPSVKALNEVKTSTLVIAGDLDSDNGNPKDLQLNLMNSELKIVSGDHNNTYKGNEFAMAIMKFLTTN